MNLSEFPKISILGTTLIFFVVGIWNFTFSQNPTQIFKEINECYKASRWEVIQEIYGKASKSFDKDTTNLYVDIYLKDIEAKLWLGEIKEAEIQYRSIKKVLNRKRVEAKTGMNPISAIESWFWYYSHAGLKYEEEYFNQFVGQDSSFTSPLKNYLVGRLYFEKGKNAEALQFLAKALESISPLDCYGPELKVRLLYLIGKTYSYQYKFNLADEYLTSALQYSNLLLASNNHINAQIYMELGWLHSNQGRFQNALREYKEAELYIGKYSNNQEDKASLDYRLGVLYSRADPQRAIGYYNDLLSYYQSEQGKDFTIKIAKTYSNLGLAYELLGEYDQSILFLKKAISIYEKKLRNSHPSVLRAYMNIARLFLLDGDYENSELYHKAGIKIIETNKLENHPYLILFYFHLGETYSGKNDFSSAKKYLRMSIELDSLNGFQNKFQSLNTYFSLIEIYFQSKDYLALDSAVFNALDLINIDYSLINEENVIDLLKESDHSVLIEILIWKAKSDLVQKNKTVSKYQDALNTYSLVIAIIENSKSFFLNSKTHLDFVNEWQGVYDEALSLNFTINSGVKDFNSISDAFLIAERKKGTILLSNLNKLDGFSTTISDQDKGELETLEEIIAHTENQINHYTSKGDSLLAEQVKRKRFQAQKSYDSLKYALEEANPAFARSKYNSKVISLDELQSTLSPSETLLEYFRTDTALYAFAINREDVSFQKLDLPKNFDPELDQFLVNSKSAPKNNTAFKEYYAGKAHELYQTLVEPLLDSLKAVPHQGTSQLIIVPDGKLGYLPWDALLTEMPSDVHDYRNYPLLLKKFSIRQAYSATLMKLLEEKEMEEKALMAAFAPAYMTKSQLAQILKSGGGKICGPPDEERFEELSQSSQELDEILAHIKGARFDTLNASETRFKEISNDYRILHLTMHGFTDDCDPMYSGLVFTPRTMLEAAGISDTTNPTNEGILHAYEIYNMRLNAELVVMSACQTGLGKIQAGEGIMSLARAFAHAGSPNTVMSLWQVQESSTRKLMENFYEYLDARKGKDEALRLAKLDFINGNGIAHPFYWAGFTLIGDDKPIVEDNWFQKNWWMLAIGFFFLLGIYAVLRKYSSSART